MRGWTIRFAAVLAGVALLLSGCGGGEEETVSSPDVAAEAAEPSTFELASTAFADSAVIPGQYTCDGTDLSPPLTWSDPPDGTVSFALLLDDPDAPGGTFTHWIAWGFDAATSESPEGASAPLEGENSFGMNGYLGPCPPEGDGPHRYVFRLFALDSELALEGGASKATFEDALDGKVVDTAELVGTYERG